MPERHDSGPATHTVAVSGAGSIRYSLEHDFTVGMTRFTVDSARVRGVFVIVPYLGESLVAWRGPAPLRLDTGTVAIICGDGAPHEQLMYPPHGTYEHRPYRPAVNGNLLTGVYRVAITAARHGADAPITAAELSVTVCADGVPGTKRVNRTAANRAVRVMAALVRVWADQPAEDLARLRRVAAHRRALGWLDHLNDAVADLRTAQAAVSHALDLLVNEHRTCVGLLQQLLQPEPGADQLKPGADTDATD
ncbi:hypothetical protein [Dactylosporangium darangshiense]|uniref:Uncharacterized protein n=1 Tax=Dactylosporangium darangshiense TaxID=579108 RepID=A0ABP8DIC5_9ACTN